jgi:hypothetical protein
MPDETIFSYVLPARLSPAAAHRFGVRLRRSHADRLVSQSGSMAGSLEEAPEVIILSSAVAQLEKLIVRCRARVELYRQLTKT